MAEVDRAWKCECHCDGWLDEPLSKKALIAMPSLSMTKQVVWLVAITADFVTADLCTDAVNREVHQHDVSLFVMLLNAGSSCFSKTKKRDQTEAYIKKLNTRHQFANYIMQIM